MESEKIDENRTLFCQIKELLDRPDQQAVIAIFCAKSDPALVAIRATAEIAAPTILFARVPAGHE